MSRHYKGVSFPELEIEEKPTRAPLDNAFPLDVEPFIAEFQRVFRALESGASTISKGAVTVPAQVNATLIRFKDFPCKMTMTEFLSAVLQGVGMRAYRELIAILNNGDPRMTAYMKGYDK